MKSSPVAVLVRGPHRSKKHSSRFLWQTPQTEFLLQRLPRATSKRIYDATKVPSGNPLIEKTRSGLAQRQKVLRAFNRLLKAAQKLFQIFRALDKINIRSFTHQQRHA